MMTRLQWYDIPGTRMRYHSVLHRPGEPPAWCDATCLGTDDYGNVCAIPDHAPQYTIHLAPTVVELHPANDWRNVARYFVRSVASVHPSPVTPRHFMCWFNARYRGMPVTDPERRVAAYIAQSLAVQCA